MTNRILKDYNGKYAIWSDEDLGIVLFDATPEEIFQHFLTQAAENIHRRVMHEIQMLDAHIDPGNPPKDWSDALVIHEKLHGPLKECSSTTEEPNQ